MATKQVSPVRLGQEALVTALQQYTPGIMSLDALRAILSNGDTTDAQKVKSLALKLRLKLLPLADLIRPRGRYRQRNPDADRAAQWWQTIDLIWRAIHAEERRREDLLDPQMPAIAESLIGKIAIPEESITTTGSDYPDFAELPDGSLTRSKRPRTKRSKKERGPRLRAGENSLPLEFIDEGQ